MDASVSKVSAVRSTNSLFAGHSVAPVLAPYGQVLRKLSRPLRVPINIEIAVRGFATGNQGVARKHGKMTEYSSSQAKTHGCAQTGALANDQTTPLPRVTPMPTQVIEFWTPRLFFAAMMRRLVRGLFLPLALMAPPSRRRRAMNHGEGAPRRWLLLGLVFATTAAATFKLFAIFRIDGLSALECLVLGVFAVLFSWIAASFWVACVGAYELWKRSGRKPQANSVAQAGIVHSRTALAVPIYNEDCTAVFAAIETMKESLREVGALDHHFDFFVLSDTQDPDCRADEESAWRRLRRANPDAHIYYRNRSRNIGRKSGNIADFCVNWGALYEYMVVLDADSLMSGRTLTQLVALMDNNPRAGAHPGRAIFDRRQLPIRPDAAVCLLGLWPDLRQRPRQDSRRRRQLLGSQRHHSRSGFYADIVVCRSTSRPAPVWRRNPQP